MAVDDVIVGDDGRARLSMVDSPARPFVASGSLRLTIVFACLVGWPVGWLAEVLCFGFVCNRIFAEIRVLYCTNVCIKVNFSQV